MYSASAKYWRHIGLYAYRRSFLEIYPALEPSPFECEELEQLRILYAGHKIKVVCVEGAMPGVDVQEDLERIINLLKSKS